MACKVIAELHRVKCGQYRWTIATVGRKPARKAGLAPRLGAFHYVYSVTYAYTQGCQQEILVDIASYHPVCVGVCRSFTPACVRACVRACVCACVCRSFTISRVQSGVRACARAHLSVRVCVCVCFTPLKSLFLLFFSSLFSSFCFPSSFSFLFLFFSLLLSPAFCP